MALFFPAIIFILVSFSILTIYRMLAGPTVFDRILGVSVIGNKAIIILCLIGLVYNRVDMFVDIALAYALLNFIVSLAAAKYINEKGLN
jgi:multicomponent Na+:H+ antiporter subunit F